MAELHVVDRTDLAILSLLAKNARISNKELATAVGLAPSSCHERLKALREKKVLLSSHIEVDLNAIGFVLEALLFIQLAKLGAEQVDDYLQKTAAIAEVRSVFLISGHFDLVVHVAVRNMEHLKRVISERFHQTFVMRVETSVVFSRLNHHALPEAKAEI
jgi:DNA-binding Lrp family transcriptional regulator